MKIKAKFCGSISAAVRTIALALMALLTFISQISITFAQSVQSICSFPQGPADPKGNLVQGPDGNFYGTTINGGTSGYETINGITSGYGTIFKVTTNGVLTTLHSFNWNNDGANPLAGLTLGPDGNFYGTTEAGGGTGGTGSIFKITPNGVLTTLFSFASTNGANPMASLSLGSDNNFYGMARDGGKYGYGTVFEITSNGVLTTLHSFTGYLDGGYPEGALTLGLDGNFYATTEEGGSNGVGNLIEMTPNGTVTELYSFSKPGTNDTDGYSPQAGLTLGPDGNFYGMAARGGSSGNGTIFKVTADGVFTTLHSFSAGSYDSSTYANTNSDGMSPQAGLTLGPDGNFYGTTEGGGTSGYGMAFQMTPEGVVTPLYSFTGVNDGIDPYAGLTLGSDGNFYGTTTYNYQNNGGGTVFEVTSNGTFAKLTDFAQGANPMATLTMGPDGNFYGTTENGGIDNGVVFEVTTNGLLSTLHIFGLSTNTDGALPNALALGPDGSFYGTTEVGGSSDHGLIFKVTANGLFSALYSFTALNGNNSTNSDGADPWGSLSLGPDGNFYGTTEFGGSAGYGTVFEVTTNGVLTTVYSFSTNSYGMYPEAGLTLAPDGNFYGTTEYGGSSGSGTIFKVTTSGTLKTLYSFTGGNDGGWPQTGLTLGRDSNFYGTTSQGGTNGSGSIFKVTTNGMFVRVYSFTGGSDGGAPQASLTVGPDGNLYGTTSGGGNGDDGTAFEVTTNGALTTLYSFSAGNYNSDGSYYTNSDGASPDAGLTLGSDGNFYGTTFSGGAKGVGAIFRLNLLPQILQQPASQAATIGSRVSFSVLLNIGLYSFQWLSNNIPIPGGTNSTFTISSVTAGDIGNYSVIVSDAWGQVTSSRANLIVGTAPTIANEPANETVPIGDTATFAVSAGGSLPLNYQWYFDANNLLTSATNINLAIAPAITNDDGNYQVIVTNLFGSATSDVASLTVLLEPNISGISNNPSGGSETVFMGSYPDSTNYLYATTNLALPLSQWQLIATNVANSDGLFQFIDSHNQNVPAKFYRLSDQLIVIPISISSVSLVAPEQNQTITISGTGFGTQGPYNGDSDYLYILDVTGNWQAGYLPPDNLVTLNVTSWTDNQIVISGFTGDYHNYGPPDNWTLEPGDNLTISVWNPQTGDGPATASVTVSSP